MPSAYIYIPALLFCAPLILGIVGTFTAFAVVTSFLAVVVVSVRLGFLVIEFSGGVVMDSIGWGIKRIIGANPFDDDKNNEKNTKDISNMKSHQHQHQHPNVKKHHHNKPNKPNKNIRQTPTSKLSPKITLWENTDSFNGFVNNFVSNDDYFIMSNKRPNGRRARSDYIL